MNEFDDRMSAVARAQLELLELVHRSVLDVVAARKRLEERIGELEQDGRRIAEQHDAAVAGGEEQAELLAGQSARVGERIGELRADLAGLRGAEELLTARADLMQEQIADFRNAMVLVSAKVVAARTSAVTAEALDTLRDALTYIEVVVVESKRPHATRARAQAAAPGSAGSAGSATSKQAPA